MVAGVGHVNQNPLALAKHAVVAQRRLQQLTGADGRREVDERGVMRLQLHVGAGRHLHARGREEMEVA